MNYFKDFRRWHKLKEIISGRKSGVFFQERDIWFCYLGVNVGYEQDGRGLDFYRPVVIMRKFNQDLFWGIPTTSKNKDSQYYFRFNLEENDYSAIISQMRVIDKKRLIRRIGILPENQFIELKQIVKHLLK